MNHRDVFYVFGTDDRKSVYPAICYSDRTVILKEKITGTKLEVINYMAAHYPEIPIWQYTARLSPAEKAALSA